MAEQHLLKTEQSCWEAIRDGAKTAEFRRNDRGFEVGDELLLRCVFRNGFVDPNPDFLIRRQITHIVRGPAFGIPEGYAMLSLSRS
jgi:hypothetical protein